MNMAQRNAAWVFETHTPETMLRWAEILRYTYFFRAIGGHMNDGDEFKVCLSFSDTEDLKNLLKQLGVEEIPVLGAGCWASVQGIPVFLFSFNSLLWCLFLGADGKNMYEVSEKDFENAVAFEKLIDAFGWKDRVDRSLETSPQCMTKERILASRV